MASIIALCYNRLMNLDGYMLVEEAAIRAGVGQSAIRMAIKQKRLIVEKVGITVLIHETEFAKYMASRRIPGPVPKKLREQSAPEGAQSDPPEESQP
jgi:excisionase family DNA binding protein